MIDSIKRREFLKVTAIAAGAAAAGGFTGIGSASAAPAARPVLYEVNGRKFEGMIVYDDGVKTRRPVIFMQPDWKGVDADTIAVARTVAGKDYIVLMADMFGAGYGSKPKTVKELAAGMSAVHKDLAFTIACSNRALRSVACRSEQAGPGRCCGGRQQSAIARVGGICSNTRAPGRISRRSSCFTSPIPIRSSPELRPISRGGCWRSTARPIR